MNHDNPQNPSLRRAYCVRARPGLAQRLEALGLADAAEALCEPTVVMTEALPFEGKLEGYRATILSSCKEAFLAELLEFLPLSDTSLREALLGQYASLDHAFDLWWTAEEVQTIEIRTTC